MRAILWNTLALPITDTTYFHVSKFLSGFIEHNIHVTEINDPNEMKNIGRDDIVYISHHGLDYGNMAAATDEFLKLARLDCIFIMWHFHEQIERLALDFPAKFVLTGEYYSPNSSYSHEKYDAYRKHDNYIPVKFLSSLSPSIIGKVERNPTYDAQFVGSPYQPILMEKLSKNFSIIGTYTPPYISEKDRLLTFLSARCTLGFHAPEAAKNGLVTERVAEGLALGCAVVSDNPLVEEFTDGCATYASSYDDFANFLERARNDSEWLRQKQQAGYRFATTKGTYTHLAGEFLKKFRSCKFI